MVDPDDGVVPLDLATVPELDLVVLQSGSELALSWAGCLSAAGYAVVNPHRAASACRDKVVQTSRLRRAGLPVPESWVTSDPRRLRPLVHHGPLVVRPARGCDGRGVHVVTDAEQLAGVDPAGPWLVTRHHPPEEDALTCYRIGDEVVAVEPGRSPLGPGRVGDPGLRGGAARRPPGGGPPARRRGAPCRCGAPPTSIRPVRSVSAGGR